MRKLLRQAILCCISCVFIAGCGPNSGKNAEKKKRDAYNRKMHTDAIIISHSWGRPAQKGSNSAVYASIYNGTRSADTLQSISSAVAEQTELHESYLENGMTGMRATGPTTVKADSTLQIKPGSYHIMLMNLKKTLAKGDSIRLSLKFSESGEHQIEVPITHHP